ncbi:MAG TPA: ATP-dependent DNA helicase RecG, partial [Candidatus Wirthbacteria bacterium]|nr:ATP-dependent DNA helicase RecG [Candidatus Wirthbacteria bacterium]
VFYFPRRYEDYSRQTSIKEVRVGAKQTLRGTIWQISSKRSRKGLNYLQANLLDGTGVVNLVWFNQGYLKKSLKENQDLVVSGLVENFRGVLTITNPAFEIVGNAESGDNEDLLHVGRIVPIYPQTEGLTSKWLRAKIRAVLDLLLADIPESLPSVLLQQENLLGLHEAIEEVHFPSNQDKLAKARERLGFEELFYLQLKALQAKQNWQAVGKGYQIEIKTAALKEFKQGLPFMLTTAQNQAIREILTDQKSPLPMNRLLEGDVGSGKTIVACIAILNSLANGYQAALMAPTEILAEQHYLNLGPVLVRHGYTVSLLTSARQEVYDRPGQSRADLIHQIESGEIELVIGTHALLQEDVIFKRLSLVVIDEQHRFGVDQRGKLTQQPGRPDVLVMTATPIPRTLALAMFGDLDISIIDQLPAGRQLIKTNIIQERDRLSAYEFVRKQLKSGYQAFVVCPLVEESEKMELKAATEEFELLQSGPFKDFKLGLLHGRMKSKEKEQVIAEFRSGQLHVLVTTAVVEVGVDIPNATIMMIEGAERFGLAQLHQFRGRVGRGSAQSYCLLFSSAQSEESRARLQALVKSNDGFALAEKDLELRGPGEVFGSRQSGIPDLRMASLLDARLLKKARQAAEHWLDQLSDYPQLAQKIQKLSQDGIVWN